MQYLTTMLEQTNGILQTIHLLSILLPLAVVVIVRVLVVLLTAPHLSLIFRTLVVVLAVVLIVFRPYNRSPCGQMLLAGKESAAASSPPPASTTDRRTARRSSPSRRPTARPTSTNATLPVDGAPGASPSGGAAVVEPSPPPGTEIECQQRYGEARCHPAELP